MSSQNISWHEARRRASELLSPLAPRELDLAAAAGMRLAGDLTARSPLPSLDFAAMDGYAVAGTGPWEVVGAAPAGSVWSRSLAAGTAVEIATGAPTPSGTDAVHAYEQSIRTGAQIVVPLPRGVNIRRQGEECRRDDLLVTRGSVVTPAILALAAATGHDTLAVIPQPKVAALLSGDELLTSGLPAAGRIRDAIGPLLPGLVGGLGGLLSSVSQVADANDILVRGVLESDADVIVITGSTSRGLRDHLRRSLTQLGATYVVDGVNCRPGHPQLLAQLIDGRPLIGLPGNPLAAVIAAMTLLGPVLARLGGGPDFALPRIRAEGFEPVTHLTRIVPAHIQQGTAFPVSMVGSAMLRGLAHADHLAIVTPESDDTVALLALPWQRAPL